MDHSRKSLSDEMNEQDDNKKMTIIMNDVPVMPQLVRIQSITSNNNRTSHPIVMNSNHSASLKRVDPLRSPNSNSGNRFKKRRQLDAVFGNASNYDDRRSIGYKNSDGSSDNGGVVSPKFTDDMNGRNIRLSIEQASNEGGREYGDDDGGVNMENFFNVRGGKKETL